MSQKFYQTSEKTTDVWLTPPDLVQKLGHFDLDPCSPNNLPWKLADKFYSLENGEDGLALSWEGRLFVNPPYSGWAPFIKKLSEHNNGIALIFAKTETKGWHDHVWPKVDSILFIKRRLKFLRSDFKSASTATQASVLIAYGAANTKCLETCGIEGKLIKLK